MVGTTGVPWDEGTGGAEPSKERMEKDGRGVETSVASCRGNPSHMNGEGDETHGQPAVDDAAPMDTAIRQRDGEGIDPREDIVDGLDGVDQRDGALEGTDPAEYIAKDAVGDGMEDVAVGDQAENAAVGDQMENAPRDAVGDQAENAAVGDQMENAPRDAVGDQAENAAVGDQMENAPRDAVGDQAENAAVGDQMENAPRDAVGDQAENAAVGDQMENAPRDAVGDQAENAAVGDQMENAPRDAVGDQAENAAVGDQMENAPRDAVGDQAENAAVGDQMENAPRDAVGDQAENAAVGDQMENAPRDAVGDQAENAAVGDQMENAPRDAVGDQEENASKSTVDPKQKTRDAKKRGESKLNAATTPMKKRDEDANRRGPPASPSHQKQASPILGRRSLGSRLQIKVTPPSTHPLVLSPKPGASKPFAAPPSPSPPPPSSGQPKRTSNDTTDTAKQRPRANSTTVLLHRLRELTSSEPKRTPTASAVNIEQKTKKKALDKATTPMEPDTKKKAPPVKPPSPAPSPSPRTEPPGRHTPSRAPLVITRPVLFNLATSARAARRPSLNIPTSPALSSPGRRLFRLNRAQSPASAVRTGRSMSPSIPAPDTSTSSTSPLPWYMLPDGSSGELDEGETVSGGHTPSDRSVSPFHRRQDSVSPIKSRPSSPLRVEIVVPETEKNPLVFQQTIKIDPTSFTDHRAIQSFQRVVATIQRMVNGVGGNPGFLRLELHSDSIRKSDMWELQRAVKRLVQDGRSVMSHHEETSATSANVGPTVLWIPAGPNTVQTDVVREELKNGFLLNGPIDSNHILMAAARTGVVDLRGKGLTDFPELLIYAVPDVQEARSMPGGMAAFHHGLITQMHLGGNSLQSLPPIIARLVNLRTLTLEDNHFSHWPSTVCGLTNLRRLCLDDNSITYVSNKITKLVELEELSLAHNRLHTLGDGWSGLTSLTRLDLEGNELTSLPDSLGECQKLFTLRLNDNRLSELPGALTGCTALEQLELEKNLLYSLSDIHLERWKMLRRLNLRHNRLTTLPVELGRLSQLERLQVEWNPLEQDVKNAAEEGLQSLLEHLRSQRLDETERKALGLDCHDAEPSSKPAQEIVWRQGRALGAGSYGRVVLGLDEQAGRLYAVKQITLRRNDWKQVSALESEISLMKRLRHRNIVRYVGTERTGDTLNIFLDYVPGGSIAKLLVEFGALSETTVRTYTRQTLEGLAYLHAHGIVHRDIKGANLLVSEYGEIKLADFGLSKRIDMVAAAEGSTSITGSGIKGTICWMAPEMMRQEHEGVESDIWSVGCVVVEMMTGETPWSQYSNINAVAMRVGRGDHPVLPPGVSNEGKDFLEQCFVLNPLGRPSAADLLRHPFASDV